MTSFNVFATVDIEGKLIRPSDVDMHEMQATYRWESDKTRNAILIMSDAERARPNSLNIVITDSHGESFGALTDTPIFYVDSFKRALDTAARMRKQNFNGYGKAPVYMINGPIEEAVKHPCCHNVFLNTFQQNSNAPEYFPMHALFNCKVTSHTITYPITSGFATVRVPLYIRTYTFINEEEATYHRLLSELLSAPARPNRTEIPTRGAFMRTLRFNLTRGNKPVMPILTTKEISFKAVVTELLWFLRAEQNTEYLHAYGVKFWDANTTREALDARGLTDYKPGETGPIYGNQWRNWNGVDDYRGVDQLQRVIGLLKTDPWNRRMIVTAWNPEQNDLMCLPACHYSFQFHVTPNLKGEAGILNCAVNMRSADLALGVPFNIASYSLLTHIVALICDMKAGELAINMVDCHLYENHIDGVLEQLNRRPYMFPTLEFDHKLITATSIDEFANADPSQIKLVDYCHYPRIKLDMAV